MFLEQDDEEEKLMGGGGKLAPEKRRFRESEYLSLARARDIIKKKDKDGKTTETFFNERGKESSVMKKRRKKRFEAKEARANDRECKQRHQSKNCSKRA